MCHDQELNLKQVARTLDVHYMTAYRYVRAGRLPARREGNAWMVRSADVDAFRGVERADHHHEPVPDAPVDWPDRLRRRLLASDESGAWAVVEAALTSGWPPEDVLLDMVGPALAGCTVEDGPAGSLLAAATAQRVSTLLAGRFRRRGRWRGSVVLGAPPGEHHAVASTMLADLLRLRNIAVLELGVGAPPAAFVDAAGRADRLVAAGVSVTTVEQVESAGRIVRALRAVHPELPVFLGGQAIRSATVSATVGASDWAGDGRGFLALVEDLLPSPRGRTTASAARTTGRLQQ